ncbi:MAG: serine/threonine protein kinase [Myxococcales bacterium]|nr:serine/threonine protein kinase [Myxococcales bacterium]
MGTPRNDELGLARTETPTPEPAPVSEELALLATTPSLANTPRVSNDAPAHLAAARTQISRARAPGDLARTQSASAERPDGDAALQRLVFAALGLDDDGPPKIGRFTILRRLGAGGMGIVYAAYDDALARKVAIKLLRPRAASDWRARLVREAQAMARLSHANIATVYETGDVDGQLHLVMEFVRGATLDQWLKDQPRSRDAITGAFTQAGRGLQAAHEAGLVHRDFKPHNVIYGDDGVVKVLDFGLARAGELEPIERASSQTRASSFDVSLTQTGAILGTPAYMAPEQHRGAVATAASDQYSFYLIKKGN